jgi:NADH dehydrogenase
VVHLAAATGKAAPRDYFRVNVNGTKTLIEQCERAGVSNFLFVSTIAVKFRDKAHYHYALSKEQAEEAVNRSTINHTIVRPALILGAEAELWRRLSEHAKAPVVLVFGDGKVKIQPIYIEDLIDCLLAIIAENEFRGHTLELGGPEAITFDDFFKRIHLTVHHKEPRVLHLPLGLILPILSCMEKILHSALPVSVGQLASFHNDGTIERNQLFDRQVAKMKSIGEMFELILH